MIIHTWECVILSYSGKVNSSVWKRECEPVLYALRACFLSIPLYAHSCNGIRSPLPFNTQSQWSFKFGIAPNTHDGQYVH